MTQHIPNKSLTLAQVPPATADWDEINLFAHTFDGYTESGSFDQCAEIAHQRRNNTLTELRTCLFFEARALRHGGDEPEGQHMIYLRELVSQIRDKLDRRDIE